MKVDNTSPKYISRQNIKSYTPTSVSATHAQNFGAGAAGNAVISLMDAVDRGGLVASFLIQDFFGMNIPRTVTGLYRNREITNQYNYQEAAEVAIREFMSGPTMFAVPMVMLWAIKRMFGKANDIPVNILRVLGNNFAEHAQGKTVEELTDLQGIKKSFYNDTFKNILKNTYKGAVSDDVAAAKAEKFTSDLLEYENLKAQKKTKSFWDKIRGKKVPGTAEEKLEQIVSDFSEINKSHAQSASSNFLEAKISSGDKTVGKQINKLFTDMRNFVEDASDSVAKQAKKGNLNPDEVKQFFKKFTDFRTGSRVLTNFSMLAGIIAFCSIIPKLYQLSENNPGLKGLEGDAIEADNTPAKDEKSAKPVAFKGAMDGLGRLASKDGSLAKFFREFEFDAFNVSFTGLLTACGLGVLAPRLYHAREENEYKEVLFRDTITIGTIACAAKILQQVTAKIGSVVTGLALSIKPDGEHKTALSKLLTYLRPVKGHSVLTSEQLHTKYTNVDKYKGGLAGFARFIDEQDGNISKAFDVDKNAKALLKQIYEKSEKSASVSFDNAKNKDIIEALDDVIKGNKAEKQLNDIYAIFRDEKNKFLRKAKIVNSSFNFAVLFIVAPLLLGYVIPRLNEFLTKKRQLQKHEDARQQRVNAVGVSDSASKTDSVLKDGETPKVVPAKVNESKAQQPNTRLKQSNSKAFSAFKEIINP